MHMRTKKWARPELAACPFYIPDPVSCRGKWNSLFKKEQPLYIELGCGKGVSTAQMAFAQQSVNLIAADITSNVLGDTRRNIVKAYGEIPINNILLTRYDLSLFDEIFSNEDRIQRMYINFCNPWTKRPKYEKRRLTHTRQLMQYRHALCENGEIWFKTDNDPLFDASLKCFEECGFEFTYLTRDLHRDGFEPNYISEHEMMYMNQGIPIKFTIARMLPASEDVRKLQEETIAEISRRYENDKRFDSGK